MRDTNVGIGMAPCSKNCRCPDCEIDRLLARNAELETSLLELVDAMHLYEMDSDGPAPQRHREMMRRAKALAAQRGGE